MIQRYTRPEMGRIWSEENSFQKWLDVEILAAEGLARLGKVPKAAIARIRKKARFDVKRIRAIEGEVKHEIIAFLSSVAEFIGDDARYLHVGMTSSDVMDTALAIQFKEASVIIEQDIKNLMKALRSQARKYKWTVQIGRTHGVHAEPITFGLKLALWYQEMARNLSRFKNAVDDICVGQISGAVGTFAQISPKVEAYVCRKAGLKPALVSNQIIQRDRHAYYFATLAIIASSLEKFAVEVRHLQRTEVQEAEEPFTVGPRYDDLRQHTRLRISGGELFWGRARFQEIAEHGWCDVIMPDVKHVGGFGPLLDVLRMGAKKIEISPHNPSGPISTAASLHAAAVHPELVHSLEYSFQRKYTRGSTGEVIEKGVLKLGDKPGWGVAPQ